MYREQLLFVCSRNQWRSPTAEALFKDSDLYVAKSAGTSDSARIKITPGLINWADCIFVMEKRHAIANTPYDRNFWFLRQAARELRLSKHILPVAVPLG
jgi:predicted protein tyrosine phosphatase